MYSLLSRAAEFIAWALALIGGIILLVITALNCASIIGRALDPYDFVIGPFQIQSIRGIYDMTEIAMAAAVFAFLPWAQLRGTHAQVDLFRPIIPRLMDRVLELIFAIGMAAFAIVMSWRLYLGMSDKLRYGETTFIAQIPVWQGYALGLVGAIGFVLISLFCVLRAARKIAGYEEPADV